MKWEKVKLKEVLDNIVGGGTPSKLNLNYWGGDICWCSVKDMSFDTHYLSSTKDTITEEGLKNSTSNLIKQGTVITATRMGLGRVFINKVDMAINQDLKALIPNKKIDNLFLLWTIIYKREEILSMGRGATVNGITLDMLTDIQIALPPLNVQGKIANTMSTYDDLIENNQKQIKLLEEAAQRLYKEWFVDFRFPGYEDTKFIDGIPDGWRKERIGNLFLTVLGGTPSRANANYWNGNIPWINSGEINALRIMKESEFITDLGLKNSSTKLMPKHTTVLAITGATLGQVSYTEIETCANQSVVGIVDEKDLYSEYLYLYISNNIWEIIGKATGGAQQHINKDIVNAYHIVLPNDTIIANLKSYIKPIFTKIANLYNQNTKLEEARDRLLPKLMSGEIEV